MDSLWELDSFVMDNHLVETHLLDDFPENMNLVVDMVVDMVADMVVYMVYY